MTAKRTGICVWACSWQLFRSGSADSSRYPISCRGSCTGLGIVLLVLSAYCTSHRVERLRVRKQRLISSVLRLP